MTLTKKQIVAALREQRADLTAKRDSIVEQIERVDAALLAYGTARPTSPKRSAPIVRRPRRSSEQKAADLSRALALAGRPEGVTMPEMMDARDLSNGTAHRLLEGARADGYLIRERIDSGFGYAYKPNPKATTSQLAEIRDARNGDTSTDAIDATGKTARLRVTT